MKPETINQIADICAGLREVSQKQNMEVSSDMIMDKAVSIFLTQWIHDNRPKRWGNESKQSKEPVVKKPYTRNKPTQRMLEYAFKHNIDINAETITYDELSAIIGEHKEKSRK